MAKNIVICSDGTGNTAIKGRGTNVFKLFEAVDLSGHRTNPKLDPQLAFYDDGVGTESFKLAKLLGGAAGVGLARNVRQLYRELARVYDPGDRIFLFGFSRGAFTVRTLAGMIAACGIVNGGEIATSGAFRTAVADAYHAYRAGYGSMLARAYGRLTGGRDRPAAVAALRAKHPVHYPVRIAFIGVWDTVDAVGLPFALSDFVNRVVFQFKFSTQTLSPLVDRGCHALSIDDERKAFAPVLWEEPTGGDPRIEQVWFSGVHSNVGGGYPKQGMSLVALDWMLRKAAESGLRLQAADVELFAGHASVDDKLYDPRASLGVFYRWAPRNIERSCARNNVTPRIHLTAAERIAHGTEDYAPGNIPPDVEVVITPTGDPDADLAARERAAAARAAICAAHGARPHLLADVKPAMALAEGAYWAFVASWLVLLVGVVGAVAEAGGIPTLGGIVGAVAGVIANVASVNVGAAWEALRTTWESAWRITILVALAGFALAGLLSSRADRSMSDTFSAFWHAEQPRLREAFKQARQNAKDKLGVDL